MRLDPNNWLIYLTLLVCFILVYTCMVVTCKCCYMVVTCKIAGEEGSEMVFNIESL